MINRDELLKVFEEEITSDELLKEYKEDAELFFEKISQQKPALYGLIGEYGTGKSTFLNAVKYFDESSDTDIKNIWITFEAWKYPNRKELWDAFIIQILSQVTADLSTTEDFETFVEKYKELLKKGLYSVGDQHQDSANNDRKTITNYIEKIGEISSNIDITTSILAKLLGGLLGTTILEEKESVSRIFDYEFFFENYWKQMIQDHYSLFDRVYIIIEDIDRCGDDGLIFLETLSYFVNNISKQDYMGDKMTCIVSIGQGFLNNHRHLINKTITNYELFSMHTESISKYFNKSFGKKEIGLTETQQLCFMDFINLFLDKHGLFTRSIREIKYLFRKIIPEMQLKIKNTKKEGDIINNIAFFWMLFNFSMFLRSNKLIDNTNGLTSESFDTSKGLYYTRIYKSGNGSCYLYVPFLDKKISKLMGVIGMSSNILMVYASKLIDVNFRVGSDFNRDLDNDINNYFPGIKIESLKGRNLGLENKDSIIINSYRLLNE